MQPSVSEVFLERTQCPACCAPRGHADVVFDMAYNADPLRAYLIYYYRQASLDILGETHFTIVVCRDCGLAYQVSVPGPDLLTKIYDTWPGEGKRDKHRAMFTAEDYRNLAWQCDWLLRHIKRQPMKIAVFDYGMGWCEFLQMARAYGCEVAGCELSDARVAYARSIGIPVIKADEIGTEQFDFINTEQVFEHLIEPRRELEMLAAALRPGGTLKFSVPNGRPLKMVLTKIASKTKWEHNDPLIVQPLEHVNCFRHDTIVRMAAEFGLRPSKLNLIDLIQSSTGWMTPKYLVHHTLRPIYRHVFPKSTCVFLEKSA